MQRAVDAVEALHHAAQGPKALGVLRIEPCPDKLHAHVQLHQLRAQRVEKAVAQQLPRRLAGGEEHRAHAVHRPDAQEKAPARDLRLAHKGGRLHPGNVPPEEGGEAFVQAVRPQQRPGRVVGIEKPAAPHEQGRLGGEGKKLGRDLDHTASSQNSKI